MQDSIENATGDITYPYLLDDVISCQSLSGSNHSYMRKILQSIRYDGDLVSIIIPVYRAEKFIRTCIDSLLSQRCPNIELIVVYSKSPDNSLSILEEYGTKIKLIKHEGKKLNPATARNVGLHHAKGKYIAFCDADDFFAPDKIEKQIRVLETNPNIGLVYTDVIRVDHNGNEIEKNQFPEWDRDYWLSHRFITFSSVAVRKHLLNKVGYFDPNPKLEAVEDFDLLIMLSKIAEFSRIPEFLTYYRVHPNSLSRDKGKLNMAEAYVFRKHRMRGLYLSHICWIIPKEYIISKTILTLSFFLRKTKTLISHFLR